MSRKDLRTPGARDLFHPQRAPITRLRSAADAMSLSDGEMSALSDVRYGNGVIETRGGMTASLGTILTASTYRGHWQGLFQGSYTIFVALLDTTPNPDVIKVYKSTDAVTWTEVTAAQGQFATTRLTDNGELIQFAAMKDSGMALQNTTPMNQDCIVWGQRATSKVVYGDNLAPTVVQSACPISDLTAPVELKGRPVYASLHNAIFHPVYDWGTTDYATIAPTGAGFTMADTSGSGDDKNRIRLSITSSVTNGSTATVKFTAGKAILSGTRVYLLIDSAYAGFFAEVKIEVGNNSAGTFSGAKEIWAASNTYNTPVHVPVDGSGKEIYVLEIGSTVGGSATTYDSVRVTWTAPTTSAPAATQTVDIMAIVAGPDSALNVENPGLTEWAVTKYSAGAHTESPAVVFPLSAVRANYLNPSEFGCADLGGIQVPLSPLLKFQYYIFLRNPTAAELLTGFDCYRIYRKRPEDDRLTVLQDYRMATYNAGWAYASGSSGTYVTAFMTGAEPTLDFTYPDAYHLAMPKGGAISTCGDRVWVGGKDSTTEALYVSGHRQPFRYRRFTKIKSGQIDTDTPLTLDIGTSKVQKIVSLASSLIGVDTVYVFTDQEIFATGGSLSSQIQGLSRVSRFGTVSPNSIAERSGSLIYLDTEMQIRIFDGGNRGELTRGIVDDQLAAIPAARRAWPTAAVFNDTYYLFFSPSGATTNTKGLVMDFDVGFWVNDYPPVAIAGLMSWFDGTNMKKRLVAIGAAAEPGTLAGYEYDLGSQSQDLGTTDITVTLTTREFTTGQDDKWLHVRNINMIADFVTGATATFTVNYKPNGDSASFTIGMGTANQIQRQSSDPSTQASGTSYKVTGSIPSRAGKKIFHLWAQDEELDHTPDV